MTYNIACNNLLKHITFPAPPHSFCNEKKLLAGATRSHLGQRLLRELKQVGYPVAALAAVVVNKDGQASADLLKEIGYLSDAELEMRIPTPGYNTDGTPCLFTLQMIKEGKRILAFTLPAAGEVA
jgi:hypothetical protein